MTKRCREQHGQDRTIGITTQNVRGLAAQSNTINQKLQGFKEQHLRGNRDVVLIQETHLKKEEHQMAARQYAALWGFKHSTADKHSLWASGDQRRAGVAILINPYGAVTNMEPWNEDMWSEHLIMARGTLAGRKVLFINIYAPANGAVRVKYFSHLLQMEVPADVDVVCGGDFNCVEDEGVDRRGGSGKPDMGRRQLKRFLEKWSLIDAAEYHVPRDRNARKLAEYAAAHHTHFHVAAGGRQGSSRLDRVYVRAATTKYVRGVETDEAQCRSDHRAVLLELHSPSGVLRTKKRPQLYPPPAYVSAATRSLIEQRIQQLRGDMHTAEACPIGVWQAFKDELPAQMRRLRKEARERMNNGFRQRIKRIKARLEKVQRGEEDVDSRPELLEALQEVQDQRRTLKRRTLMARTTWSVGDTTKRFYKRICTKFGDNQIRKLIPTVAGSARAEHDKANIMKDSWTEIFNGAAEDKENMKAFIAQHRERWSVVDMQELDNDISAEEVEAAVAACKLGKSCGPDGWGMIGHTPGSFLEAYIFSIGKGGDSTNPLNYRPIALLNTDYKIFTRILAWRLRKYVDRLVSRRQYGFVPGRTIHEVIDLLEAAKAVCSKREDLSQAQVLLLDFAKAYDSLDRDFLVEVLAAKGIPPKMLAVIRAIHTKTTVQFLANGFVSERLSVTSGIRQGCPLAPLLFIIAVDLLYDTIEADGNLEGVAMDPTTTISALRVAGYADDTAIYIAHRRMQSAAIRAVQRFSAVSGLRLNVTKSVAINLGTGSGAAASNEADQEDRGHGQGEGDVVEVQVCRTTRYLGHIVGDPSNVREAWEKAFAALKVRLALAESKTNTAIQRAQIAAAIIVPKLLYVARHAWPPAEVVKRADRSIRQYVWKSVFQDPERVMPGWVETGLAEQPVLAGGMGIPNLHAELKAMSAMVVGAWGLATDPQQQLIGDILQRRDGVKVEPLVPQPGRPSKGVLRTLWATGRPWAEVYFSEHCRAPGADLDDTRRLRMLLRHCNGVTTRWTNNGLEVECTGLAREALLTSKKQRRELAGECMVDAIHGWKLQQLLIGSATGDNWTRAERARCLIGAARTTVRQVVEITGEANGVIRFIPVAAPTPMKSAAAHQFSELCLSLVANFPALVGRQPERNMLLVRHSMEDQHHTFEVVGADTAAILHTWGSTTKIVPWRPMAERVTQAVASFMGVSEAKVMVAPHPWLTRMCPMWVGNRRWSQTRKQYKQLISKGQEEHRGEARGRIARKLTEQHGSVAKVLNRLQWSAIHRMQGVTPYQTQNIYKRKVNRLRLWAGDGEGYRCQAMQCGDRHDGGTIHLAWECPEAQQFWGELRRQWALAGSGESEDGGAGVDSIFGFRLKTMPRWLVAWGQQQEITQWEDLQRTADEMWAVGVAVMLTVIWRRNVDRLHPEESTEPGLPDAVKRGGAAVNEAYRRYRLGLLPWTRAQHTRLKVAEAIAAKCRRQEETAVEAVTESITRIVFFDGGSRGNPGPGGGGSVLLQIEEGQSRATPIWAAVTALGSRTMTNNVAEFVGLHRLLAQAALKGWRQIHVVGDSAMILRLMRSRKPPKATRMKFWYQASIRLADICGVQSWTHHYRQYNKMADYLANQAMDNCRSEMLMFTADTHTHRLYQGVVDRMSGDVEQWRGRVAEEGERR